MRKIPTEYEDYQEKLLDIKINDRLERFSNNEAELTEDEKIMDEYINKKRLETPANELFEKFFKEMPCGGNLHIHTGSTLSAKEFLSIMKAEKNIYIYWNPESDYASDKFVHGKFYCLSHEPSFENKFLKFSELDENNDIYAQIEKLLVFAPKETEGNGNVKDELSKYFSRTESVLSVEKIFKEYYRRAFISQAENGIDYMELRAEITNLVKNNDSEVFDGTTAPVSFDDTVPASLSTLYKIYDDVRKNEPVCSDFTLKLIISPKRNADERDLNTELEILKHIPAWQKKLKDGSKNFIAGVDLICTRDIRNRIDDLTAETIISAVNEMNPDVKFYFHDGDSVLADDDIVHYAVTMGAARLGYGLNLYNFPELMEEIKRENICVELCPVSNYRLGFVKDLRTHPAAQYMQRGIPCVVCSDEPQLFENSGLYHDLWELYRNCCFNLRDIKALIKNSYKYSALDNDEKNEKIFSWQRKWDDFIIETIGKVLLKKATNLSEWMKKISGNKSIKDMAIPGTHYSHTWKMGNLIGSAKFQNSDLAEQLNSGIRFLDLRVGADNQLYHGIIACGVTLRDAISVCEKHLEEHPSEAILVMLSIEERDELEEYKKWCTPAFENRDMWYLDNKIPQLKDIRGKMVLINGTPTGEKGLTPNDFSTQYVQDVGNWSQTWEERAEAKVELIMDFLKSDHNESKMCLNYWHRRYTVGVSVETYAGYINQKMTQLRTYPRGIQVMDFYLPENVKKVLNSDINYKS